MRGDCELTRSEFSEAKEEIHFWVGKWTASSPVFLLQFFTD